MSDFIHDMTRTSLERAHEVRDTADVHRLSAKADAARPPVRLDVSKPGFDVIAEAKLASPSEGRLVDSALGEEKVVELARTYAKAGAAAISVLTEPDRFAGSMGHLEVAAGDVALPVMRKDFLVDPIQVIEARAAGASGVLLIARMLPGDLLVEMTDLAISYGMFVLVEVFDTSDLKNAVRVFDRNVLVGVNSRDLSNLEVDPHRFESLAPHLPDHLPAVAESGIYTAEDVAAVAVLGYRLALVGSSLVTDPDPGAKLSDMIETGRNTLSGASS